MATTGTPLIPESAGETPRPAVAGLPAAKAIELERDILSFTDKLYETAVEDNRDYEKRTRETVRMIEYLGGKQWSADVRAGRNKPVLPKFQRHFWDSVGLLTDLSIDYQVKLFNQLGQFNEFEKLLNELAVHWAMSSRLEDRLYDIILYGLLHTGPAKVQWNSRLAGGMGDVQLLSIAPWQWATLGAGYDVQDSECVMYFPVVTVAHIARRFGKEIAERIEPDSGYGSGGQLRGQFARPSNISAETWSKMGEALRRIKGVRTKSSDSDIYPMTMLREYWLRDDSINETSQTFTVGPQDNSGRPTTNWSYRVEPGEPIYPRGRVIATAPGVVCEDTCNPYWDAKFPFPTFRPFRVPWDIWGDPRPRSWMQMSNITNRIMGGILDMIYGIIEPTITGPKGALPAADWDAIDPGAWGNKIKTNNNAPKGVEVMKKGEVPGWVFNYLNEVSKEYDMSSGASAMQQALQKKQVPGGDSLDMILSSRSLPVKVESRALASFIEEAGQMVVARQLQFYSASRRFAILGTEGLTKNDFRPIYGSMLDEGMTGEELVRKFTGVVRRDTLLQTEKDRKVTMAWALLKADKLSDRMFYRIADINFDFETNKRELIEEARIKLLLAGAAAALTGKGQGHKK